MAPLFVASVDQLEEQVGAAGGDGQIADLIDNQQGGPGIEADLLGQSALAFGLAQRRDQVGQGCAINASAGFHGCDAKGRGEVRLAGARRPEEVDDLGPPDEVELGQPRSFRPCSPGAPPTALRCRGSLGAA